MNDAREYALTIKGYLMAHNAPAQLQAGIEIIIGELASTQATISARIPIGNIGDIASRFLSRRIPAPGRAAPATPAIAHDSAVSRRQVEPRPQADHIPDVTKMVGTQLPDNIGELEKPAETGAGDHIGDANKMVEAPPEKKPRKEWSPEAKAAAKVRMEARLATGWRPGQKMQKPSIESPPAATSEDASDKNVGETEEYIGERIDGDRTLKDSDWGDIQRMRFNGLPDARIARSYGIQEDYLQRFIERKEAEERVRKNG